MKTFNIDTFFNQAYRDGLPEHVLQFQSFLTFQQYEVAYKKTLDYVQPGLKVLDWGCGNGHFSYFLHQIEAQVTGYSFDRPPSFLIDRQGYRFIAGKESESKILPFGSEEFDCVFSIGVLEHVHETGGTELESLIEIYRLLKPGGLFLCFHFPNRYQWVEALVKKLNLNEYTHPTKYTEADIRKLASSSGFTIESIGRYNFLPRNPFVRLPVWIRNSRIFGFAFNGLDRILIFLLPRYCTNYFFVARKSQAVISQSTS